MNLEGQGQGSLLQCGQSARGDLQRVLALRKSPRNRIIPAKPKICAEQPQGNRWSLTYKTYRHRRVERSRPSCSGARSTNWSLSSEAQKKTSACSWRQTASGKVKA